MMELGIVLMFMIGRWSSALIVPRDADIEIL